MDISPIKIDSFGDQQISCQQKSCQNLGKLIFFSTEINSSPKNLSVPGFYIFNIQIEFQGIEFPSAVIISSQNPFWMLTKQFLDNRKYFCCRNDFFPNKIKLSYTNFKQTNLLLNKTGIRYLLLQIFDLRDKSSN